MYNLMLLLSQFWTSCSMSSSNCFFLIYIQISRETSKVIWYSCFSKNSPQFIVLHKVKDFTIVNEADVFLEFSCFHYDPVTVSNLISGSSAFSKSSLYLWNFSVRGQLKPNLKNFEHNLASMWNEHHGSVVWTIFGIALLYDWKEKWPFLEWRTEEPHVLQSIGSQRVRHDLETE